MLRGLAKNLQRLPRSMYRTCLISDPALATSPADVRSLMREAGRPCARATILASRPVNITERLFKALDEASSNSNYEVHSSTSDESFIVLGSPDIDPSKLDFLGNVSSDSQLVSLSYLKDGIEHPEDYNVDWEDFVLTLLNDPLLQVDREAYPLYLFFARIPEEDSVVSVFGQPEDGGVYSSLVFRSRECSKCE